MKPAAFKYLKPVSVDEALISIAENQDDGKLLAGGQSLVPAMNFRLIRPAVIIDIGELHDLKYVRSDGKHVAIGALTPHATFHTPFDSTPLARLLTYVVHHIAHFPIRQRGTFGGSLAHADPASEWCLVATTLAAEMSVRSSQHTRTIPSSAFFKGTFTTDLAADEILTEIRIPELTNDWRAGFYEFSRRAGDFALGMALAAIRVESGAIRDARLGIGGVSDRAIRLEELEADMVGQPASPATFESIARKARDVMTPTADIHASSEYRRDLIETAVYRALSQTMP